jgi:hypothetical protein
VESVKKREKGEEEMEKKKKWRRSRGEKEMEKK